MTSLNTLRVERVTAPATEPISMAQAKLFLRIDHAEEDTLLAMFITAAREAAEEALGKSLITQSQRLYVPCPKSTLLALPRGPVQSIQTVATEDGAGEQATLDSDTYRLHAGRGLLQLYHTVTAPTLIVTYVAGFGDGAEDVPSIIRQGLLNHVAAFYETRETQTPMPELVKAFYLPYREVRL